MTTRLTRTRTRRPAVRSSIDIWSVQSDDFPSQPPHITFPTITSTQRPSSHPNSPAAINPDHYSSPKSSPSVKDNNVPFSPDNPKLVWRDSSRKATPAARRKEAEREVLVRQATAVTLILVALIFITLFVLSRTGSSSSHLSPVKQVIQSQRAVELPARQSALRKALGRKPVPSFRDHLEASVRYVTSPQHGGFAHQSMSLYHLTYLSGVLGRTPIVPPFFIDPIADRPQILLPASQVFDMDRFRTSVNVSAIDWNDVQAHVEGAKLEQLGCWIASVADEPEIAERTAAMQYLGLEPSFFPLRVPSPTPVVGERSNDLKSAYSFLAAFDGDASAKEGLIDQALHSSSALTLSNKAHQNPEQHLFCVDHSLFHTASVVSHLDQYEHTAFRSHGEKLRFNHDLDEVGGDVVAFVLGHRAPFVVVHISARADCVRADGSSDGPCTYSLLKYVTSVERVRVLAGAAGRKTREQRHQIRALNVLVTTDITDIAFLGEIVNLGWSLLDHHDHEVGLRFGKWAPSIVESVVHSRAAAFVGTKDTSESTIAALRVRAWRNGPVELV